MRAKEHIIQPSYRGQILEVVCKPSQHPRHAVVRLHLGMDSTSEGKRVTSTSEQKREARARGVVGGGRGRTINHFTDSGPSCKHYCLNLRSETKESSTGSNLFLFSLSENLTFRQFPKVINRVFFVTHRNFWRLLLGMTLRPSHVERSLNAQLHLTPQLALGNEINQLWVELVREYPQQRCTMPLHLPHRLS